MSLVPGFAEFRSLADRFDAVPVWGAFLSDGLTPVSAFRQIDDGGHACLFESVVGGERVGRYSFLSVAPRTWLTARAQQVTIEEESDTRTLESPNPLHEVRRQLKSVRVPRLPGMPPFAGGAVGYAGYDVVRYAERLPNPPPDDRHLPDLVMAFYDRMLVFDHVSKTLYVMALAWPSRAGSVQHAYQNAQDEIQKLVAKLDHPAERVGCDPLAIAQPPATQSYDTNFAQTDFEAAVRRCIEYIEAGDIFQVVLSQRLSLPCDCPPLEIYRSLRVLNPSPFMFFLRTPDVTLVGSSPEIMCRVVDGKVTVRPLAGTRSRGRTEEEDRQLEERLLADSKERAEHAMLVDLGRNDVGRVAKYGTVELPELMIVERYSHVMHLSSTVTGVLRDDCDAFDALLATLPAGTVSGAPKVRAMQIIDEIEPNRRGPYAGAVGYFDYTGNMDTCITLRTLVLQNDIAYIQAGAGIVADSKPTDEYRETLKKAQVLLQAIQVTQARLKALETSRARG